MISILDTDTSQYNVLIACEESQAVCLAFRRLGFNAYSNDIQECSGGHPEYHIQGDSLEVVKMLPWHLMIAHPPCTYLSRAGARWLFAGGKLNVERYSKGMDGKDFLMKLLDYESIPFRCVENPRSCKIYELPPCSQEIHPYQFGEPYTKATRLWLRGLPLLISTNNIGKENTVPWVAAGGNPNSVAHSAKERSKTFPGIAEAMAYQWGTHLVNTIII